MSTLRAELLRIADQLQAHAGVPGGWGLRCVQWESELRALAAQAAVRVDDPRIATCEKLVKQWLTSDSVAVQVCAGVLDAALNPPAPQGD